MTACIQAVDPSKNFIRRLPIEVLAKILMETKRVWPGPHGPYTTCWMVAREVEPAWLDIVDHTGGFWSWYDSSNGERFLAMVAARSGNARLRLTNVSIGRLSAEANEMREFVMENAWKIEELSVRVDDEEVLNEVMAKDFGALRIFEARHGVNGDPEEGWGATTALSLGALDWLRERAMDLEGLGLRRVLVSMDRVGTAVNLRRLSLFGVDRKTVDDSSFCLDIATLCRLGGSMTRLEDWEIAGVVALDKVCRVDVVELAELRRLRLDVKAEVIEALLDALVLPGVKMLEVKGDEAEDEALRALQAVRALMDGTDGWQSGVGHMSLGETWTGQLVMLDADYGDGECRVEWRARGGFELVKVGSVLLETLRVEVVKTLRCRRWPRMNVGTAEDWRRLWRGTWAMDVVSIDNGGGEEAVWDNLPRYLLLDATEASSGETRAWSELTTVRLTGVFAYELMLMWLDWLDKRVEKGLMLDELIVSGKLVVDTEEPSWDSNESWGGGGWGGQEPDELIPEEEWLRRFTAVSKHVDWHRCTGSWGNRCLECGSD